MTENVFTVTQQTILDLLDPYHPCTFKEVWSKLRFTPVQSKLLQLLSDGQPHSYNELLSCLSENAKLSSLKVHLSEIRKIVNPVGEEIICEIYKRKRCYRHINLLRQGREGTSWWLYKEFVYIVSERDNGICQGCGKVGDCVHHIKSWRDYPELRLEPSNGILLCSMCHDEIGRKTGTLGRPKGSVDDPTKRAANPKG